MPQLAGDVGDAAAGAQRLVLGDVLDLQAELGAVAELDSNTPALYDVPSTTCSMPASAMRDSRWVRNGRPAVGSIGLGAESVNGRSRVPWPPTRTTASTCAGFTVHHLSAVLSPAYVGNCDHQTRARGERALHRPPQRRLPPFGYRSARKV